MSLPTQRALIMLFAYYFPGLWYLRVPIWRRLMMAFVLIVALEPAAIIEPGFWLSFAAVGAIAYVLRGRVGKSSRSSEWLRLHLATSLGLVPLTLYFFNKVSLVMVLANAVAVPWVTLLIVPISLLACVYDAVMPASFGGLFWLAADLLSPLWYYLQYLSSWSFAVWLHHGQQFAKLLVSLCGVLLLLSPLRWAVRLMGLWYLAALFF